MQRKRKLKKNAVCGYVVCSFNKKEHSMFTFSGKFTCKRSFQLLWLPRSARLFNQTSLWNTRDTLESRLEERCWCLPCDFIKTGHNMGISWTTSGQLLVKVFLHQFNIQNIYGFRRAAHRQLLKYIWEAALKGLKRTEALTLFTMGSQKGPSTSFSSVTSTNVGLNP